MPQINPISWIPIFLILSALTLIIISNINYTTQTKLMNNNTINSENTPNW